MIFQRVEVDPKCRQLSDTELFSACDASELERVAAACTGLRLRPGTVLTRELRAGSTFFVVTCGRVGVTRRGRRLGALGRGSFFGGGSLARATPCNATLTVEETTDAFVFDRTEFRRLLGLRRVGQYLLEVEAERAEAVEELVPGHR